MSYNSVTLNSPNIDIGPQAELRKQLGIENIYFTNGWTRAPGGDVDPVQKLDKVDMHDEVTRRVDPATLPLDKLDPDSGYVVVNGKNYVIRQQDVGGGKKMTYIQPWDYKGNDKPKYALIGGKTYEVEFEKDENHRIQTFLTTSVKDLFQEKSFYKDASPSEKLALIQQLKTASAFISSRHSGEMKRQERGDEAINPEDMKLMECDGELKDLETELREKIHEEKSKGLTEGLIASLSNQETSPKQQAAQNQKFNPIEWGVKQYVYNQSVALGKKSFETYGRKHPRQVRN